MIYLALAAYNEEKNIGPLFRSVAGVAKSSGAQIAAVIVNDGSRDRTAEVVQENRDLFPITLIDQPNAGFTKALTRALRKVVEIAGDDDICITMDSDNTQPPEIIPELCRKIQSGSDVVIASRYQAGGRMVGVPPHREFLSHAAKIVMRSLVGVPHVKDYSMAYRAYRVGILRRAFEIYQDRLLEGRGFSGLAGCLIRLSYLTQNIDEVPLVLRYDLKKGASSMSITKTMRGYLDLVAGHMSGSYRPK